MIKAVNSSFIKVFYLTHVKRLSFKENEKLSRLIVYTYIYMLYLSLIN